MAEITLLHITDCHVFTDPNDKLLGLDTAASLEAVITASLQENIAYDAVLLTGDLIQDGKLSSYERVCQYLAAYSMPIYWVPGNHDTDDIEQISLKLANIQNDKVIQLGQWQVIMLTTRVPGKIHGFLSDASLQFLEQQLQQATSPHVFITMHHNPVAIPSQWLQQHCLKNPDAFWSIIEQYPAVKFVLFGHIHQQLEQMRGPVQLYASPSTSIQFLPNSDDFALDKLKPGYRIIQLQDDGQFSTVVKRIEDFDYTIDEQSKGY